MKKEDGLKFFLLGIGVYVLVPVAECVSNWLQSQINRSIAKIQFELEEAQAEHQATVEVIKPVEPNANCIGFQYDNPEDGEEYYDE